MEFSESRELDNIIEYLEKLKNCVGPTWQSPFLGPSVPGDDIPVFVLDGDDGMNNGIDDNEDPIIQDLHRIRTTLWDSVKHLCVDTRMSVEKDLPIFVTVKKCIIDLIEEKFF